MATDMLVDGLTRMGAMELLRKAFAKGKMVLREDPMIIKWIAKK